MERPIREPGYLEPQVGKGIYKFLFCGRLDTIQAMEVDVTVIGFQAAIRSGAVRFGFQIVHFPG